MTRNPRTDVVARQYQKWQYPEPIQNLDTWLSNNWQWFDPSHSHRILWPDRPYQPDMDILIAGCGTNQAAVFAYNNRAAKVVAIDVSQASLDHSHYLKDKYALKNLELQRLPIEDVLSLNQTFDLVVSTGVLHHLVEPQIGMNALAQTLRSEGVAAIMLYARYGRAGVELMQSVFREMGLKQDKKSLQIVKAAIDSLPSTHPLHSYLAIAPDLQFDAGRVDTFLHGRDRSYTVQECLDLVKTAGLVFQDWFLKSSYEPVASQDNAFFTAVSALPKEQQWGVMERINHRNGCHFFTACRPERPPETYRIDIQSEQWLDAVPMFRYRCGLDDDKVVRPGWSTPLADDQLALLRLMDGHRTIRDIMAAAGPAPGGQRSAAKAIHAARELFEFLVNRDFVVLMPGAHR